MKNITKLGASDPFVQIADELKKLQEDVHRVVSGGRKPRIDVYTSLDRQSERQRLAARRAESAEATSTSAPLPWWRRLLPKWK
jgi:hypothetical protein